ncbi:hypothetical protein B0H13DRAFT_1890734 [Mycena leptocephala]|nr:hypothetical protein B0H13DRAFT_1890734 [Mycena leptocephala]
MASIIPLPRPGTAAAPCFDGTNLTTFITFLPHLGSLAGLTPLILAYCSPDVRAVLRFSPELALSAKNWRATIFEMQQFYGSSDASTAYTIESLRDLCARTCGSPTFTSFADVQLYLRSFTEISGSLRERGLLTAELAQVYFVSGLPLALRCDLEVRLPEANRGTSCPPTIAQVLAVLRDILRPDSFNNFVSNHLLRSSSSSSRSPAAECPPSSPVTRTSRSSSSRCFVCGASETHRLGPRFCPCSAELVRAQLAKFDTAGRLVAFDGSALPMTRLSGGVAALLLSSAQCTSSSARGTPSQSASCFTPRGSRIQNPPHSYSHLHSPLPSPSPSHAPRADAEATGAGTCCDDLRPPSPVVRLPCIDPDNSSLRNPPHLRASTSLPSSIAASDALIIDPTAHRTVNSPDPRHFDAPLHPTASPRLPVTPSRAPRPLLPLNTKSAVAGVLDKVTLPLASGAVGSMDFERETV